MPIGERPLQHILRSARVSALPIVADMPHPASRSLRRQGGDFDVPRSNSHANLRWPVPFWDLRHDTAVHTNVA
jgi:hypothetical protein